MQSKPGSSRTLTAVGALSLLALLSVFGVLTSPRAPSWPRRVGASVECQPDRRTIRHTAGAAQGAGFYQPCLIDTGMTTGETGLAINREGALLRSVATNPTGIAVSTDNGATWQRRLLPKGAPSAIADGYLDPVTNRYFYSGAGNTPVYGSDDLGITWKTGAFDSPKRYDWNKVFSGRPVSPRSGGYPTNIYYCNWPIALGVYTGTRCFKSVDGGRVFKTTGPDVYVPQACRDLTQHAASTHGRGVVDPRDGTIYLPVNFCGAIEVAVSHDEGASWTRHVVAPTGKAGYAGLIDAIRSRAWGQQLARGRLNMVPAEMSTLLQSDALAMDVSGRLYIVWIDADSLPVLSWSANGGQTWSSPVRFGAPGVVQAVLPSLAVAPDGRVGISYYGSTDRETWTGYLTISGNATASAPTFETASITRAGEPLMPEPCCWASGPEEYTAARWAPDGSLWAAFAATARSGDARGVLGHLVRR